MYRKTRACTHRSRGRGFFDEKLTLAVGHDISALQSLLYRSVVCPPPPHAHTRACFPSACIHHTRIHHTRILKAVSSRMNGNVPLLSPSSLVQSVFPLSIPSPVFCITFYPLTCACVHIHCPLHSIIVWFELIQLNSTALIQCVCKRKERPVNGSPAWWWILWPQLGATDGEDDRARVHLSCV
mmetsp:Transcript_11380/g.30127  ORF Transcript_11380/g.30127 Transcript_11380/m.30127 type:complete len:183 (+) Transcript_11380:365-913(+)